ncbi:protein-tyrosine phosphatase [Novosphingobium taihuense]|nr:protein-tyrosine phosphatase [Novosphingobium taihuense]
MVLRSGHPGGLTATGQHALGALALRAIVDLRSNSERMITPFPPGVMSRTHYWARDHDHSTSDFVTILRNPATSGEAMRQFMLSTYEQLPFDQSESIAAMLRLLATGEVPLLVNCTAGKDRTGVACAVLLTTLGVEREQVIEDYALTEQLEDPAASLFTSASNNPLAMIPQINPDVWHAMNRSDPDYLHRAFAVIEERHGTVAAFVSDHLGLSSQEIACLHNHLLEG